MPTKDFGSGLALVIIYDLFFINGFKISFKHCLLYQMHILWGNC